MHAKCSKHIVLTKLKGLVVNTFAWNRQEITFHFHVGAFIKFYKTVSQFFIKIEKQNMYASH
ncbi:hypothetical protein Hdeb2414_s0765g00944381 [Helianthus debilis subsp. tardiflorus]